MGPTSIQTPDELKLFIEQMKQLIVPQRLPSGRISARALKPVRVLFEDATEEPVECEAGGSKPAGKQVSSFKLRAHRSYHCFKNGAAKKSTSLKMELEDPILQQ
jgi:hypothetical protein